MDLEQFKSAWQADDLPLPQTKEHDMKQIEQMIQNKVDSVVAQQRTHFRWAMIRMLLLPIILFVGFYLMSDGFTNPNDPLGALAVMMVIPLALFFFFGQRYLATRNLSAAMSQPTRETLPKVRRLLQQNQFAELGLLAFFSLLLLGGGILMLADGFSLSLLPPLLLPLLLISVVTVTVWRGYQTKQATLSEMMEQLEG